MTTEQLLITVAAVLIMLMVCVAAYDLWRVRKNKRKY